VVGGEEGARRRIRGQDGTIPRKDNGIRQEFEDLQAEVAIDGNHLA
jgi:hypothetical protein